jgi:hypothetical protein|tara:strand:+ start:563 stop:745 length:183 start_codon:yes stop_codon:yes gene_type:complete
LPFILTTCAALNRNIIKCKNLAAITGLAKQLSENCAGVFLKTGAQVSDEIERVLNAFSTT